MSLLLAAPQLTTDIAERLVSKHYGFTSVATSLPSERDQNFLVETTSGDKFVLKIANGLEDASLLDAQNKMLEVLGRRLSYCPRIVPTIAGELVTSFSTSNLSHFVRLVTYLPGQPLASCKERSRELLLDFGEKLGRLDHELASFHHPALSRSFHWDLANGPAVISAHSALISNQELKMLVMACAEEFESEVVANSSKLRRTVIHADANDYNVLVNTDSDGQSCVSGIIDFGDAVLTYTVAELAVAIAYVVLSESEILDASCSLISGYSYTNSLNDAEIQALFPMVKLRLCMSVCLAAYQQQQQPENKYLDVSQLSIRETIPKLAAIHHRFATKAFQSARINRHP